MHCVTGITAHTDIQSRYCTGINPAILYTKHTLNTRSVPPLIDDGLVPDLSYLDYHIRAHGHERTMTLPARRCARLRARAQMKALQQQQQQPPLQADGTRDTAAGHPQAQDTATAVTAVPSPDEPDAATTLEQAPAAVASVELAPAALAMVEAEEAVEEAVEAEALVGLANRVRHCKRPYEDICDDEKHRD